MKRKIYFIILLLTFLVGGYLVLRIKSTPPINHRVPPTPATKNEQKIRRPPAEQKGIEVETIKVIYGKVMSITQNELTLRKADVDISQGVYKESIDMLTVPLNSKLSYTHLKPSKNPDDIFKYTVEDGKKTAIKKNDFIGIATKTYTNGRMIDPFERIFYAEIFPTQSKKK